MNAGTLDAGTALDPQTLTALVEAAVQRCALDLHGARVLTEAATGPYVVTPVLAALAGAEVTAVTRGSRYGTVDEVRDQTLGLAARLGVAGRISITTDRRPELFAAADVVTNSGHLRPIVGEYAAAIRPDAVVPLMFEAWEIQAGRVDIDLDVLRARGVRIAGTNERHPDVDVFSYLGAMAAAQLADAGVAVSGAQVGVLCDNDFRDYLVDGLGAAGASVSTAPTLPELIDRSALDALVVALRPTGRPVLGPGDLRVAARRWPGLTITQFWGDVDCELVAAAGLTCWPPEPVPAGHMGVLPARVGPEPVLRLQAGGLKVAQVLRVPEDLRTAAQRAYLDPL